MNDRDLSLDYVKGFLVISMVAYHTISYYTTAGYSGTGYLRFVTGSFIFISGYIVAVFYQKKFELNKKKVCIRLIVRGLKLIIIFTSLNLIINLMGIHSHKVAKFDIDYFFVSLEDIYITGNSKYSVFQIILPIAYLLILSPLFLTFHKWKKIIFLGTFMLMVMHEIINIDSFNVYGLYIGLAGISIGLLTIHNKIYCIQNNAIIIALFCMCVLLMKYFDSTIITYTIGVVLVLKLIFDFSQTQNLTKQINKLIVLLGQYSLLSYLMQIFILQGTYQFFIKQRFDIGYEAFIIFIMTTLLLTVFILFIDFVRKKLLVMDKLYKLVFQ